MRGFQRKIDFRRAQVTHGTVDTTLPDEHLSATSDYFWMLRSGVLEDHSAGGWRDFRDGYFAIAERRRRGPVERRRADDGSTFEGALLDC